MDAYRTYNRANAIFLFGSGAALFLTPSFLAWVLLPESRSATPLELLFARGLGLVCVTLSFLSLLLSGELSAIYADSSAAVEQQANSLDAPHATPALHATTFYHAVAAVMQYTSGYSDGLSGGWLTAGSAAHAAFAVAGLFLVLFGKDPGHRSRRTGADKRTSGFPFTNAEAAKQKAR